jgi:uncharacterized membrane protein YukC
MTTGYHLFTHKTTHPIDHYFSPRAHWFIHLREIKEKQRLKRIENKKNVKKILNHFFNLFVQHSELFGIITVIVYENTYGIKNIPKAHETDRANYRT